MSKFRTIRTSDQRFERDGLKFITAKSKHLKGRGDVCVWVPENTNRNDLPIVILLHGVYGSSWSWALNAGAHHTASRLIESNQTKPMILAMPSDGLWGDGSGYLPHNGRDFEAWIAYDVAEIVKENVQEASNSKIQFITGLSMGGFGALRIGAKYSKKFKAFSGHSSITSLEQMALLVEEDLAYYRQNQKYDETVLETILKFKGKIAEFRFDCGTEDQLLIANRELHQSLLNANIPHIYEEFEGGHEWPYWEKHLEQSLLFFNEFLKADR